MNDESVFPGEREDEPLSPLSLRPCNTFADVLFVYYKNKKIKTLSVHQRDLIHHHLDMLKAGYEHTASISPMYLLENLFNNVPDEELRKEIQALVEV